MLVSSVLDLVGGTPLVLLGKFSSEDVKIYAKLEYMNPSGSIKDRIIIKMLRTAEMSKALDRGKVLVEPTSGNTGLALALIGSYLGYRVTVVVPRDISREKKELLRVLGAEIMEVEDEERAFTFARELVEKYPDRYFMLNQFENEMNIVAHYMGTAREIWNELRGNIDYVVVGIGTAGTIMGLARFFKERKPEIRIIGVVPERAYEIDGTVNPKVFKPPLLDERYIDEVIPVSRKNAVEMMIRLAREEGILAGISSGAALYVAVEISKRVEKGNIVIICADNIYRYIHELMGEE